MNECPYLAIITEHHGQWSVLRLQGELDVSARDRLRHAIDSALESHPPILVVDLSGLDFADCAGLSILVYAQKLLVAGGSELVAVDAKPIVLRLLQLTGLDTYLHLGTLECSKMTAISAPVSDGAACTGNRRDRELEGVCAPRTTADSGPARIMHVRGGAGGQRVLAEQCGELLRREDSVALDPHRHLGQRQA